MSNGILGTGLMLFLSHPERSRNPNITINCIAFTSTDFEIQM
jgi:hypothetical protein